MNQIEEINGNTLPIAAEIHAASWRESQRAICSPEFVAAHTKERQLSYLQDELGQGKRLRAAGPHQAAERGTV